MRPSPSPVVYVVQQDERRNLLPAERYGTLEFLLPQGTNIMFNAVDHVARIRAAFAKNGGFHPSDSLLLIGDPAAIALAAMLAAEETGGEVQVLKWDNREFRYYPVTLDIRRS
jgi:hypothetical protein